MEFRPAKGTAVNFGRNFLFSQHYPPKIPAVLDRCQHPYQIKDFAASELKRSKPDEIDGGVIARFARSHRPANWTPQPQGIRELQEVERYLVSLKANVTQESNRLESGIVCPVVRSAIQQHIEDQKLRINDIKKWARQHVRNHQRLNEQYELITSIAGIGNVAAFTYLGELGYSD